MKRKILASILLFLILSACSAPTSTDEPANTPSQATEAVQQQAAKVTPTTGEIYPAPNPEAVATAEPIEEVTPSSYPAPEIPTQSTFDPIADTSRYGIAKVDAVLDALMSTNIDEFSALLVYTNAPCTLKAGLGGPPKCVGDEKEGTLVDGFPTMGPEGSFLPKSQDNLIDMPGHFELLGVFSVKADFQSEQYYPAGKYGIVLHQKGTSFMITLRVTEEGIVRADYIRQMPNTDNQPDLDAYLTPKS